MKRDEILWIFQSLARSQGMYGRILRLIDRMTDEEREVMWQELEAQDFEDAVDLVLYIEG